MIDGGARTDSWAPVPEGSPYGLVALPYAVGSVGGAPPRPVVRIGDSAVALAAVADAGLLDGVLDDPAAVAGAVTLDPLLAAGRPVWTALRTRLAEVLRAEDHRAEEHRAALEPALVPVAALDLVLPFTVADYVDFYSSEHHARNVGMIFRPDAEPLLPNWKHLPVGYHGRAGTVVVSGTDVVRPCGQRKGPDGPVYGPSGRLDVEAEVGFVVGTPSALGDRVPVDGFSEHVFGVVLVNDWSARDIQAWEYVPLGPFLGKSFATSISAWVLPLAALHNARVPTPPQDPPVLDYLREDVPWGLDLELEVRWNGDVVSRPPFASMYWSPAQQLAHLTVNGASVRTGDLFASGTVSGPGRTQRGSFLELSWNGTEPVRLADGTERTFLADGDTVTITATAPGPDGSRVGLGEVIGRILPAPLSRPGHRAV